MNAAAKKGVKAMKTSHHPKAPGAKRTVTLGELVSAAYEVAGSASAVAQLLSPVSPLSRRLSRRILVAGV